MSAPPVVLASTSRYRAELLRRLLPAFRTLAPGVDEAPREGESPQLRAERLAEAKARAVAGQCPGALVIGSDQVAELGGRVLDKPGDHATACRQLAASSGRSVYFHTAVCVLDTRGDRHGVHAWRDLTKAGFRHLDADEIERYVTSEKPLDCAGSFKCEALGISLFEYIETQDPTALVGLPLIAVARLLRECGHALP
jgi:septum formation protein